MRYKNKNKIMSVYLMLGMVMLVIGFSYAFFIYNKTGLYTHTITGGKMKVIYDETVGNNILIENAYPRTDKEALTYGLEFEFTVTGYNESEKNVYYAIEIDYGEDLNGKNRFLDTDMKLTLLENDKEVFENEIFYNLDNQDIYYNYFKAGTNSQNPVVNNYKLRIWINDNVIISDTLSDDLDDWTDFEWNWLEENYNEKYWEIDDGDSWYLSDYGMTIYTSDEFANSYANFKVNIKADLNYKDVDHLIYDANGGEYTPEKTSLLTNMITLQKPVMENKGFLGWSSDPLATEPEYKSGDYYTGSGQLLYAIYSDTRNVMGVFPEELYNVIDSLTEVYFINDTQENIDEQKTYADLVVDLTYNNQGKVMGLVFDNVLWIASEGTTYLSTGEKLFNGFTSVEYIYFGNCDSSMITSMSSMFGAYYDEEIGLRIGECSSLVEVDFTALNTSNVEDMSWMFACCFSFDFLTLENLDTSNVINMQGMFYEVGSSFFGIGNWDTSKVEDMSYMFSGNPGWYGVYHEFIDVGNWDTSSVRNMSNMFYACRALPTLDVSNWDTSKVEDMSWMFSGCWSLEYIDVSNWNTENVWNMTGLFSGYRYGGISPDDMILENLNVSKWDTSKVETMSYMFSGIQGEVIGISNFNTGNVIDMSYMFALTGFNYLDLSNWDVSKVENMSYMFSGEISNYHWGSNVEVLDLSNWNLESLVNTSYMFYECYNLTTIYSNSDWDNGMIISSGGMFNSCRALIGQVRFDYNNSNDITYANPDNGYFTRKNV